MKKNILCAILFFTCFLSRGVFAQDKGFKLGKEDVKKLTVIDSLELELKRTKEDTNKVILIRNLNKLLQRVDPKKALEYSKQQLALSQKLAYKIGIAWAYRGISFWYLQSGQYDSVIYFDTRSNALFAELHLKPSVIKGLLNLGIAYNKSGNGKEAIHQYLMALKEAESIHDTSLTAKSLGQLGNYYFYSKDPKTAMNYFLRSLNLFEAIKDEKGVRDMLLSIGSVYFEMKEYKTALIYYERSLAIFQKIKDKTNEAHLLLDIGSILIAMGGNSAVAEEKLLAALAIYEELLNSDATQMACATLGTFYNEKGNYAAAKKYADRSLSLAQKTKNTFNTSNAYLLLSEIYTKQNNPAEAYKNYKLYSELKDTLRAETTTKQIAEMEAKYQNEKKQKENELLSQKNENQQLQLSRNRYLIFGLTGSVLFVLLIAFLLIRQNKLRTRQTKIELEQKLLLSQTKALHSQMNPHFIFNCMASIQSFMTQNDPVSSAKFLSKFARLIRATLENSQQPFVPLESEIKMLEDYMALEALRFAGKFDYRIEVDESIDPEITQIPSMLIQPYIENAIIHGLAPKKEGQGHIALNFSLRHNILHCIITDNGIGRKKAREIKDAMALTHKSLGMSITEERLELISAKEKIKVRSKITDLEDKDRKPIGTQVEINIPLSTEKIKAYA